MNRMPKPKPKPKPLKRQKARGGGMSYTYITTVTDHKECMDKLAHKCNWEHMTRLAVLREYSDIVCDDCKKIIDMQFD